MTAAVLTEWSALSPFGLGAAAFSAGVSRGVPAVTALGDGWDGPDGHAGLIPDFDPRVLLGRKGTRSMDRVTGIAVVAIDLLFQRLGGKATEYGAETGLVLGTGSGSVRSIMEFTREALTGDKPYHVDPALFPNTVLNRAAGQSAIWHGLKGPNTTIAGGALTGLLAVNYALRLHRGGHCAAVLCGAVEEYSTERAWLERTHGNGKRRLGEGGAVFLIESAELARASGRVPLASVPALAFAAFPDVLGARAALRGCVEKVLRRAGIGRAEVALVLPSEAEGAMAEVEELAIGDVVGAAPPRLGCKALIGDTSAAAAAFQLAAAVAIARGGDFALLTALDRDGTAGAAIIHKGHTGEGGPSR
ncbi:beta-ketoacyl synthase N-terminal-like domain-containing protein [Amycolatopsis samaneae]|uniref:Beta-ketoacyl synthase N-terminal-like domain-containing protein n=1 Tax=Amycolatopsis samaneae TaxID=664691 RepID=A0ABW5GP28_9PSEU